MSVSTAQRIRIAERDRWHCVYCGCEVSYDLHGHEEHYEEWPTECPDTGAFVGFHQRLVYACHIDHVLPRSRGGTDDDANLVTACWQCNSSKGALTLGQWHKRPRTQSLLAT